jgi:transposase
LQGKKLFQQALFVSVDLETLIPKGHILKKINEQVSFDFLSELTREFYCPDNGRASIDPEVYFRMLIVKYLFGIGSDRKLCEEVGLNIAYRWFCRFSIEDAIPHHSPIGKIRDRLGVDVFEKFFNRILLECKKAGLLKGRQLVTDATLIKANASSESLVKRDVPTESFAGQSVKHSTHVSTTDPDATSVGRSGKKGLFYKSHTTVDGDSRVITDCHVTTGSKHECRVFLKRVDEVINKFSSKPQEWLADKGYGHGPTYERLSSKGIRAYIPLRDKKLGRGKNAPINGFSYNKKNDEYICPAGEVLEPHAPSESFTRYVSSKKSCENCQLKSFCLKENKSVKWINRSLYQDKFDAMHRRSSTKLFKKRLAERSWKVEGIFGEGKNNHCLDRAHYRGKTKVQIQVLLISTVQNLKRLVASHLKGLLRIFFIQKISVIIYS